MQSLWTLLHSEREYLVLAAFGRTFAAGYDLC
jgi:hypothetical protein